VPEFKPTAAARQAAARATMESIAEARVDADAMIA
jgi:hypothetical protein